MKNRTNGSRMQPPSSRMVIVRSEDGAWWPEAEDMLESDPQSNGLQVLWRGEEEELRDPLRMSQILQPTSQPTSWMKKPRFASAAPTRPSSQSARGSESASEESESSSMEVEED